MKKGTLKYYLLMLLALMMFSPEAYAYDEPLFVTITTENCYSCKKLKPVLEELEYEYSGKIQFITLDVSSRSRIEESRYIAEENKIDRFFEENKNVVPRVGILCPGSQEPKEMFTGEVRREVYEEALNKILSESATICSL